ncbi:MAG: Coenzyme F420 hydrogenase/dehydrogenase, beta subunit C-terminal domain [Nanoarchaeota archaeon]|nr:Coenzyme F420 hydrogenase/dehydrogenase, beta subunit C-terminal domain [Nanoarchaeota archaeon]
MKNTIEKVTNNNLCNGCGTCIGICPVNAISLRKNLSGNFYLPLIDKERCINCGKCYNVCPGHSVDFKKLNQKIFGKQPENKLIGNFIKAYTGFSKDENLRFNCSSGALVTELLLFLLENREIDGALVTTMNEKNPLEPKVILAKTKKQILNASKSKYCPVALGVGLKEVLKNKGKFAVVGLPCHIHGIRKAEQLIPDLKDKIKFHFGLVCMHTMGFLATEYYLKSLNIKKEDIKEIQYRGKGWPGFTSIYLKNGKKIEIPRNNKKKKNFKQILDYETAFHLSFIPERCLTCTDGLNELADITFGDAWLPEYLKTDNKGTSLVITRTKKADELIERVKANKKIELNELPIESVIKGHKNALIFKKSLKAKTLFLKKPNYNQDLIKNVTIKNWILSFISIIFSKISKRRWSWLFLNIYPFVYLLSSRIYFFFRKLKNRFKIY